MTQTDIGVINPNQNNRTYKTVLFTSAKVLNSKPNTEMVRPALIQLHLSLNKTHTKMVCTYHANALKPITDA